MDVPILLGVVRYGRANLVHDVVCLAICEVLLRLVSEQLQDEVLCRLLMATATTWPILNAVAADIVFNRPTRQ